MFLARIWWPDARCSVPDADIPLAQSFTHAGFWPLKLYATSGLQPPGYQPLGTPDASSRNQDPRRRETFSPRAAPGPGTALHCTAPGCEA
jgi:hypothetical protein